MSTRQYLKRTSTGAELTVVQARMKKTTTITAATTQGWRRGAAARRTLVPVRCGPSARSDAPAAAEAARPLSAMPEFRPRPSLSAASIAADAKLAPAPPEITPANDAKREAKKARKGGCENGARRSEHDQQKR